MEQFKVKIYRSKAQILNNKIEKINHDQKLKIHDNINNITKIIDNNQQIKIKII